MNTLRLCKKSIVQTLLIFKNGGFPQYQPFYQFLTPQNCPSTFQQLHYSVFQPSLPLPVLKLWITFLTNYNSTVLIYIVTYSYSRCTNSGTTTPSKPSLLYQTNKQSQSFESTHFTGKHMHKTTNNHKTAIIKLFIGILNIVEISRKFVCYS